MAGKGDKNIKLLGFGTERGADPKEAGRAGGTKRWSIRNAVRRLCAQEFDFTRIDDPKYLQEFLTEGGRRNPTLAEMLALKRIQQAMASPSAMEMVVGDIDGKLVEKKAEVQGKSLAELIAMSHEIEEGRKPSESDDEED